jgi:hypothetical protein
MIIIFEKEHEYFTWLEQNSLGYVVDTTSPPTSTFLMLHHAACAGVNLTDGNDAAFTYTGEESVKICSSSLNELKIWAAGWFNTNLVHCERCFRAEAERVLHHDAARRESSGAK